MEDNQHTPRLLYTTAEAAEILHCNIRTVRTWIADGRLPSVIVGRKRLIRVDDIERVTREGIPRSRAVKPASTKTAEAEPEQQTPPDQGG